MAFDARAFLEELYAEPTAVAEFTTPEQLPGEWQELFEERAAIRQFDGGQARDAADRAAFREILARMRTAGGKC